MEDQKTRSAEPPLPMIMAARSVRSMLSMSSPRSSSARAAVS